MTTRDDATDLVVVIPAYNAAHLLPQTLIAWLAQTKDVVVVDAGSKDATTATARRLGARVVQLEQRAGPAEARNAGAAAAGPCSILLFGDADCVPAADVVDRTRRAFADDPDLVSLTGSYDDRPTERNFASLYMNLRHHAVHHMAARENSTFWAGCGAVRRTAFEAVGGFDAAQYPRPMIEDIELGMRLRDRGAMRLDPDLQVKHLKRWTIGSVVTTDIFCRALPWSTLLVRAGELPNDLNVSHRERIAAAIAPFALVLIVPAIIFLFAGRPWSALIMLLPTMISLMLHWRLLRVFARGGGAPFAAAAWAFHQVHLIYSAAAFAWCAIFRRHRAD